MPRVASELSALEVKRLTKPGMHAVGGVSGLLLRISPNGQSRSWIYRITIAGKRRHIGLGPFPTVTLAMARELARDAYMSIRKGVNPLEEKKAARSALIASERRRMTFSEAMEKYLTVKLAEFESEKHRKQWWATLDRYAVPGAVRRMRNSLLKGREAAPYAEHSWRHSERATSRLSLKLARE